jgi:hypothetical protein
MDDVEAQDETSPPPGMEVRVPIQLPQSDGEAGLD